MNHFFKEIYEAPKAKVLVVRTEGSLLSGSTGGSASREGDGNYGDAIDENWG